MADVAVPASSDQVDELLLSDTAKPLPDAASTAANVTLHDVCHLENVLVSDPTIHELETRSFGQISLPLLQPHPAEQPPLTEGNVTMFAIACFRANNGPNWCFNSHPATLQVSDKYLGRWDCHATHQGTISVGDLSVTVGVRQYEHGEPSSGLRFYLGLAQSYLHATTSLICFREQVTSRLDPVEDFTDEEWDVLHAFRFMENLVGLKQEESPGQGFPGFTAEERLLLEAFSHWTYEESGQTSIISGFQGVGTILTEAVIHDTE
ncbi:uncharacterized protein MELLADRAFT_89421 [Melampsora larici-populina 98AG31]|uniref:Alpha-type protein kinase domain-containing protein n=1 Tax=Melampsora larici-populina (strain 98AG31 / pathotype 3-4-7) TaxID=747676 RepID=F4SE91_MELLP|nr:uncharacterized protein MELLADRAFT_89421 [Melampsora larici-populina 98AG31]EGF97035.1 hypothetical protein MELLADRAFT_89421 [Melampsora larici-populina 98AG31]